MLKRLHIRNYAIISELDIALDSGLTIITGETGAGKSILVGALSLVLGKRTDASVLFQKENKCIVEAYFDISGYGLEPFFEANDLDLEPVSILRREITLQGRSRAFINDTPVNLSQLKACGGQLIDIHSQHAVLMLNAADFKARFLDVCADSSAQFGSYSTAFGIWDGLRKKADHLSQQQQQESTEQDYLQFQLQELEEFGLNEGELQSGQERLTLLENAEEIQTGLSRIIDTVSTSENSLTEGIRNIEFALKKLSARHPKAGEWEARVHQGLVELEDISDDMAQSLESICQDPEELARLQQRVDEILRLMTKHQKRTDAELLSYQQELDHRLLSFADHNEELIQINAELSRAEEKLEDEAGKLSLLRKETAARLSTDLYKEMPELGMPQAQILINVEAGERTAMGSDSIEMTFSANKGQALQELSKVASGGELSRLLLAMKAQMARYTRLPSIIFDEVDTGVSGKIADRVGKKIKELSSRMQVLCITHLPQIASKADQHLHVYKELEGGRTVTRIRQLDRAGRIDEIAKMLSNAAPTEAALQHARQMMEESPSEPHNPTLNLT